MDGCSTMARDHNGVKVILTNQLHTSHLFTVEIIALRFCFVYLLPKFDEFKGFDSLLLNLYLLLKNNSVKQSIFDKVQAAYSLQSLKLVKAAVTCWLSHGKAVK